MHQQNQQQLRQLFEIWIIKPILGASVFHWQRHSWVSRQAHLGQHTFGYRSELFTSSTVPSTSVIPDVGRLNGFEAKSQLVSCTRGFIWSFISTTEASTVQPLFIISICLDVQILNLFPQIHPRPHPPLDICLCLSRLSMLITELVLESYHHPHHVARVFILLASIN